MGCYVDTSMTSSSSGIVSVGASSDKLSLLACNPLIGLCNVVVGMLLLVQPFSTGPKKIASWLCMSAVLLPIGLILRGMTNGDMTFAPVAVLGGVGLLGTFVTLFLGYRTNP